MDLKELNTTIRKAVFEYIKWWYTKNAVEFGKLEDHLLIAVDDKDYFIKYSIEELRKTK